MKSILLLLIAASAFLYSCQENVTYDFPEYQPKLVVYSLLKEGKIPQVYISKSKAAFDYADTVKQLVTGARVIFMNNLTGERDSMLYTDSGYIVNKPIVAGTKYSIETHYLGLTASGITIIPKSPVISSVNFNVDSTTSRWGGMEVHLNFNIKFMDIAGEANFYRLRATQNVWGYDPWNQHHFLESNDHLEDFFNDRGSDGQEIDHNYTETSYDYGAQIDSIVYEFTLESVNEETRNFITSASLQAGTQGDPLTEPTIIHGNISGGLGMLGGQSESKTYRIRVK